MTSKPIPVSKLYDYHYFICENQETLFRLAQNMNFDDDDFIEKFMNSDICKKAMSDGQDICTGICN